MLLRAVFSAAEFEFGSLLDVSAKEMGYPRLRETKLEAKNGLSRAKGEKKKAGATAEGRRQKTRVVVYNRVLWGVFYMLSRARAERLWVQTQSSRAGAVPRDSAPNHVQKVEIRSLRNCIDGMTSHRNRKRVFFLDLEREREKRSGSLTHPKRVT
jgi:hypothetical protein